MKRRDFWKRMKQTNEKEIFERKGGYYKPAFFNIVEKFTQKIRTLQKVNSIITIK